MQSLANIRGIGILIINSDMGGSEASEAEAPGGGSMLCHGEG